MHYEYLGGFEHTLCILSSSIILWTANADIWNPTPSPLGGSTLMLLAWISTSEYIHLLKFVCFLNKSNRGWIRISGTNEAALDGYCLVWAVGDTDIILGVCTNTFNFTWVPENDILSRRRYPGFFADFKSGAKADGRDEWSLTTLFTDR